MSTDRELLELAARAMGMDGRISDLYHGSGLCFVGNDDDDVYAWLDDDGDCARMCAALGIDSIWWDTYVRCEFDDIGADVREHFRDHNNDRAAAWRLAALRVAAEIGKGTRRIRRLMAHVSSSGLKTRSTHIDGTTRADARIAGLYEENVQLRDSVTIRDAEIARLETDLELARRDVVRLKTKVNATFDAVREHTSRAATKRIFAAVKEFDPAQAGNGGEG